MRYLALVTDYDGTLSSDDRLSEPVVHALERLRVSGRRAILVTGRQLDDLLAVCSCAQLFDLIVAENGAIVYDPASREETRLVNPPSKLLVQTLLARGVAPLEIGQVLVATHAPHRATVQDVIWELGLEAQVIGNRGAVMVLPAGINKGTGLGYALRKLGLSRHEVAGIGDAENDHSFLERCECAVAVANAAPSIKRIAAFVTAAESGDGVIELIDELISNDLRRLQGSLPQHSILLGKRADGSAVQLSPYGHNLLVAGPSGCGKSTLAAGIIERLIEKDYQICIVDPEGDYGTLRDVVALGNPWRAPNVSEVLSILEDPEINLSVNLLGIPLDARPDFFAQLLPACRPCAPAPAGRTGWSWTRRTTCCPTPGDMQRPSCRSNSMKPSWSPFPPTTWPGPSWPPSTSCWRSAIRRDRPWRHSPRRPGRHARGPWIWITGRIASSHGSAGKGRRSRCRPTPGEPSGFVTVANTQKEICAGTVSISVAPTTATT